MTMKSFDEITAIAAEYSEKGGNVDAHVSLMLQSVAGYEPSDMMSADGANDFLFQMEDDEDHDIVEASKIAYRILFQ
jgi:hypothetical protein